MKKKLLLLLTLFLVIFLVGCNSDFESYEKNYNLDNTITGETVEYEELLKNLDALIKNFKKIENGSVIYTSEHIMNTGVSKWSANLKFNFSSDNYKKIKFYMEIKSKASYELIFIKNGYIYVFFDILGEVEQYKLNIESYLEDWTLDEFEKTFLDRSMELFNKPNYFDSLKYRHFYLAIKQLSSDTPTHSMSLVKDSKSNLVLDFISTKEFLIKERTVFNDEYKIVYLESINQTHTEKLFVDYGKPKFSFPSTKDYTEKDN